MAEKVEVKAPGRICFFGDHQDYLGLPVIAATIDRYIYMSATARKDAVLVLDLSDLGKTETIQLNENLTSLKSRDYFRSAIRLLAREGIKLTRGYSIRIHGDIPIKAGLSSSSAMVVAWVRLLLQLAVPDKIFSHEQIARWSYQTEVLEFNEPGGLMDQYTIALGGLVGLNTVTGEYQRLNVAWESIIIGDSGIAKSTLSILSKAKDHALAALELVQQHQSTFELEKATKKDYHATVNLLPKQLQPYWYAAIHNHLITQKALELLQQDVIDMNLMGSLINSHQAILQKQINNTPLPLYKMMEVAKNVGAYGAKIVGSGGGGCFVALGPKNVEQKIITALKQADVKQAFAVTIPSH